MGAAAFLMVEYLNVPYQTVILAAIVPAFMHFFGVFCQVHFEAKKNGMRGMEPSEIPRAADVIRRDWPTSSRSSCCSPCSSRDTRPISPPSGASPPASSWV